MRPVWLSWLLTAWILVAGCPSSSDIGVEDGHDGKPAEDGSTFADTDPVDAGADLGPGDEGADLGPGDEGWLQCLSGEVPTLIGLTPEELFAALEDKDFLLINVAAASGGQIPGTDTFIPHNDTAALVEYIGPDLHTHVVLYCVSSTRSAIAGWALLDLGYCSIQHLEGGLNAWIAAGYPLE